MSYTVQDRDLPHQIYLVRGGVSCVCRTTMKEAPLATTNSLEESLAAYDQHIKEVSDMVARGCSRKFAHTHAGTCPTDGAPLVRIGGRTYHDDGSLCRRVNGPPRRSQPEWPMIGENGRIIPLSARGYFR